MKKSCVIYATWADQILNLPDAIAGEYIKCILNYAIYGEETESDNPFITAMLVPVRKKLDEDAEAYEEIKRQRSEAGKKGMNSRWHNKAITDDNCVKPKISNITVTDTDTDTDKKNKKPTFHDFKERKYDYDELMKGTADV